MLRIDRVGVPGGDGALESPEVGPDRAREATVLDPLPFGACVALAL